jgi:tetratricopeptide (TPR) repeat protein
MNHALKLRGDVKRDPGKRQLLALTAVVFLVGAFLPGLKGQAPSSPTVADELRAARLMEFNLAAKNADPEEWRKLDKVYADMDVKYHHDPAVQNDWAQYLWARGEKRLAMEKWEAVTQTDPKNAPALSSLGNGYLERGEIKRAAACFTRASESAPAKASYHFDLANVVFMFRHDLLDTAAPDENRMIQRALGHFAEASRLEPLNVEYAKAYGDTFYYLQPPDWMSALAAWKHFLEITPYKDFAYSNLARVHMKLGQKAEARACLAQIQSPEFQRLKARLNERIDTE